MLLDPALQGEQALQLDARKVELTIGGIRLLADLARYKTSESSSSKKVSASTRPSSSVRKLSSVPRVIPHTWSIRGNSVADMVKDGVISSL